MNSNFKQQAPLANQAQMLANKGRYGDSMLVHMNPLEVDVLKSMTPNNQLTVNPDTGQPEAFLPILLGLAGALAGGTAATGTILGTLGAVGAGAIGSGVGTAIETGSLEEGLKAGLISGIVGGVGGQLLGSLGGASAGSATGSAAGTGVGTGVGTGITNAAGQTLAQAVTPQLPGTVLATGGSAANQAINQTLQQGLAESAKSVAASATGTGVAASNPYLYVPPSAPVTQALTAAEQSQLVNALADPTDIVAPSITQRLSSGFTDALASPDFASSALTGATTGLTGQGLTDDFNLSNMGSAPLQSDEDAEDFYVPVSADDRGVQFNNMNAGTSEYDYFSNPFSFTQELNNGGLLRTFQEGGRLGLASRNNSSDLDMYNPDSPNFDLSAFPQTYGPQKFNIPSYITDPFGTGSSNLTPDGSYYGSVTPESIRAGISVRGPDGVQRGGGGFAQPFQYRPAYAAPESLGGAASTQASNTDQVGNDLDDMIQDSFTRQVYDPRTSGPLAGIRGASDIDNIDYNQRLLGDATKEISFMRPMNEAELTVRNDAQAVEQAAADAAALAAQPQTSLNTQAMDNTFGDNFDYRSYFGLDMPANDFSVPMENSFNSMPTGLGNPQLAQAYNPQDYFNFGNIGLGGGM